MMTVIYGSWKIRILIRHRMEIRSWVNGNIIHLNRICSTTHFIHFILIPQYLALWEIQVCVRSCPCSQWEFSVAGNTDAGKKYWWNDKCEDGSICVFNEKKVLFSSSMEIVVWPWMNQPIFLNFNFYLFVSQECWMVLLLIRHNNFCAVQ